MSQQNLVPVKNVKLAIDSMREALEEKAPGVGVSIQFGVLLEPARGLDLEQAKTYLRKCRQALDSFKEEASAKMWFEVILDNIPEKQLIACAQKKVDAKLAPPAPPEEKVEDAKAEEKPEETPKA